MRVFSSSSTAPTPQQWLRTRFRCSSRTSAPAMLTSLNLPNPVVMP